MNYITDNYKELNYQLHQTHPKYGVGGKRHYLSVCKLMKKYECETVLDYGCGKATLSKMLKCTNYDPCIPKYSSLPQKHDLVVCTDVLEHIELHLLDNVLNHIKSLIIKVGYLVIATRPDSTKLLPDGSNPHQIIEDAEWWKQTINSYFTIVGMNQVRNSEVIFEVQP
jgi:2-polyprenyl-3-methyl-5-hydroxy-6-metoxy-1,4-benzoquinol methylase